jgi:carbamoyltransferase
VQTVSSATSPRLHALLRRFGDRTGVPMLINTSFNVRGEPIVCTPRDAYACFMNTNIDYLVLEDHLLDKHAQPAWTEAAPVLEPD